MATLESHVEELQLELNDVMGIMTRQNMQVLPSEAASSEFEVLATEGAEERRILSGSEDFRRGRAGQLGSRRLQLSRVDASLTVDASLYIEAEGHRA